MFRNIILLTFIMEQSFCEVLVLHINSIALIFSGTHSELVWFVNAQKDSEAGYLDGEHASFIDATWHNFNERPLVFVLISYSKAGLGKLITL